MKNILLIDFGSTYTKLTAVDVEAEEILGTSASFTTIFTDINEGLRAAIKILEGKIDTSCPATLLNLHSDVVIAYREK